MVIDQKVFKGSKHIYIKVCQGAEPGNNLVFMSDSHCRWAKHSYRQLLVIDILAQYHNQRLYLKNRSLV